jgi:hypothetical protein
MRLYLGVLALSALVPALLANSSTAEAGGGNCQNALADKSFDCTFKGEGPTENFRLCFTTGGISTYFDLHYAGVDYGCVCQTAGSFSSPKFDGSESKFECVTEDGVEVTGKIKKSKLTGQGSDFEGSSVVFSCTENATPGCG